jgi:hypothetical protein
MSQFQRETRYAVFKLKYLTEEQKQRLYDFSMELGPYNSVKECVVVESDWPNYEDTWAAIQAVHSGCYVPSSQMRSFFCDAFITAESGGEAGYCIKAKFESLSQMQNAHSALVRLLQSEKAGAA